MEPSPHSDLSGPPTVPTEALPPARRPDPGGPRSRLWAFIAALVFAGAVIGLQNIPVILGDKLVKPPETTEQAIDAATDDAGSGPGADADSGTTGDAQVAENGGRPAAEEDAIRPTGGQLEIVIQLFVKMSKWTSQDPSAVKEMTKLARTPEDRLRVAIAAAEMDGSDEALERLNALQAELPEDHPLQEDIRALLGVYGADGTPLSEADRDRLIRRHGFTGEVAATYLLPQEDPDRLALRTGGLGITLVIAGFVVLLICAGLAGLALFVTAIVMFSTGRIRPKMPRPLPGGSAFMESYAIFCGGFLGVQLLAALLKVFLKKANPDANAELWSMGVGLACQWLLLLVPLWPMLRGRVGGLEGMDRQRFMGTIGLHSGQGVFREIGAGILGYLAGLPIFALGVAISMLLMLIYVSIVGQEGQTPENPIFDLLGGANPWIVGAVVLLATIWAPLCEELIFRGGLYRHFRSKMSVPLAALASAALFGFMHGYGPLLVFPVLALGFNFALIREWRGSLIPCITAHALHNGTLMILFVTVISMLELGPAS